MSPAIEPPRGDRADGLVGACRAASRDGHRRSVGPGRRSAVSRVFGMFPPTPPLSGTPRRGTAIEARSRARGVGDRSGSARARRRRDTVTWSAAAGARSSRMLDVPLEEGPPPEGGRSPTGCSRSRSGRCAERGFEAHDDGTPLVVVDVDDRARAPGRRRARARSTDDGVELRRPRAASRPATPTTPRSSRRSSATRSARARAPTWSSAGTTARSSPTGSPTTRADGVPPAARARARRLLDLLLLHRRPLPDRRQPRAARQRPRRRRPDEPDHRHLPDRGRAGPTG